MKIAEEKMKIQELRKRHYEEEKRIRSENELAELQIEKERQAEESKALLEAAKEERESKLKAVKDRADRKRAELKARENAVRLQHEHLEKEYQASSSQVASIARLAEAASNQSWVEFSKTLDELDPKLRPVLAQRLSRFVGGAAADWFLSSDANDGPANRFKGVINKEGFKQWIKPLEAIAEKRAMDAYKKFKEQATKSNFAKLGSLICFRIISDVNHNKLKIDLKTLMEMGSTVCCL